MGPAEIAQLLKEWGGFGVGAMGIWYGLLERKERIRTQTKHDELAEKLPDELLGIVRETNSVLSNWTAAANTVLEMKKHDAR